MKKIEALVAVARDAEFCEGGQYPHYRIRLGDCIWVNLFSTTAEKIMLGTTVPALVQIKMVRNSIEVEAIHTPDAIDRVKTVLTVKKGGEDGFNPEYPCEKLVIPAMGLNLKVGFVLISSPA